MNITDVLIESSKQRINDNKRVEPYRRVRIDGLDVRMQIAVAATGKTIKEILALKDKPKKEREEIEKRMASKIRDFKQKKLEVDHKNGNKNDYSKKNLNPIPKSKHTAKTNSTR